MATKIIDFYSYKGGAGRSVTTFNTLPFLAKELEASSEKPILVIDMDLDSAGITFLLNAEDSFKEHERVGINEYFYGSDMPMRNITTDFRDHCFLKNAVDVSSSIGVEAGSVLFIGVNTDDVQDNYQGAALKTKLKEIKRACGKYDFGAVVFDSASGNQAIAHSLLEISDKVVVCMKATQQFRAGTFRYIEQMIDQEKLRDDVEITLVPVAIPDGNTKLAGNLTYRSDAFTRIKRSLNLLEKVEVNRSFVESEEDFGIPEIERFKWEERNLHLMGYETLNSREQIAYEKYRRIAKGLSGRDVK